MARKLPRLQRRLGAADLFGVAYGEIASSIYFALGIIAAHALGFTPYVLLFTGLVFLIVAMSYAEGTTELRETGGAATFVRRAFNDLAGFVAGWALFLDYLIVTALAALFLPHYLGAALAIESLESGPWDRVVALGTIGIVGVARVTRRRRMYAAGLGVTAVDLFTQALLVVLGLALLWSPDALTRGLSLGTSPSWHQIAFALPLAMLAYTGLETVANLAEETRKPGVQLPKSLFTGIGAVVVMYVGIAVVGLMAFPPRDGTTALGTEWGGAPLMGIVAALSDHLPDWLHVPLRVFVGLSGALILLLAAATSVSGFGRLAYSLGEHGQLPRASGACTAGRSSRRSRCSRRSASPWRSSCSLAAGQARAIPREPLQLRRPARLHGRAGRRDQAALRASRSGGAPSRCRSTCASAVSSADPLRSSAPSPPSRSGSSPWRRIRRHATRGPPGSPPASSSTSSCGGSAMPGSWSTSSRRTSRSCRR